MNKILLSIILLISTLSSLAIAQPLEVRRLIDNKQMLKLSALRTLCTELVDMDHTHSGKFLYPKRKKAYKRHVKQLCENVELTAWKKTTVSSVELNDLYNLNLMQKSMAKKAKEDATGMTIIDKVKMGLTSLISPFILKERITTSNINIEDPKDSIFWSSISQDEERSKRFKRLAKAKKIKPRTNKHMVLIFDGVSDGGSAPKIKTLDTNLDDGWSLKWGDELHTDAVGSRIFAALGFDVDHPYYKAKDKVTLVFPKDEQGLKATNASEMIKNIKRQFNIDIDKFVSTNGIIDEVEVRENKDLKPFLGHHFVRFKECAIEGRPDRVKRLGPMMVGKLLNANRRELKGALLAHLWIDNWDTREENTLLTNNHLGKRKYKLSGVFSDLGTSFGVKVHYLPTDFRVGLVNEFGWNIIKKKTGTKIKFIGQLNAMLAPYKKANYSDLKWMATKIAKIDKQTLKSILEHSGWPEGIRKLYFHKLASRRAQLLEAFEIEDKNPIIFNTKFSYSKNGIQFIKDGVLIRDYDKNDHPIGYLGHKGRLRNYGGAK